MPLIAGKYLFAAQAGENNLAAIFLSHLTGNIESQRYANFYYIRIFDQRDNFLQIGRYFFQFNFFDFQFQP